MSACHRVYLLLWLCVSLTIWQVASATCEPKGVLSSPEDATVQQVGDINVATFYCTVDCSCNIRWFVLGRNWPIVGSIEAEGIWIRSGSTCTSSSEYRNKTSTFEITVTAEREQKRIVVQCGAQLSQCSNGDSGCISQDFFSQFATIINSVETSTQEPETTTSCNPSPSQTLPPPPNQVVHTVTETSTVIQCPITPTPDPAITTSSPPVNEENKNTDPINSSTTNQSTITAVILASILALMAIF